MWGYCLRHSASWQVRAELYELRSFSWLQMQEAWKSSAALCVGSRKPREEGESVTPERMQREWVAGGISELGNCLIVLTVFREIVLWTFYFLNEQDDTKNIPDPYHS